MSQQELFAPSLSPTLAGFATLVGSTVTATHVDADGKPSRLRRTPGHEFTLELLPNGSKPTEGT